MNCEEFERKGLDLDRPDADPVEAQAAAQHAEACATCASLLASWREVKSDLRILRESTSFDSAPARVEMRLKQELRTRREARVPRRSVAVAGWALAAAAVLAASVGWIRSKQANQTGKIIQPAARTVEQGASGEPTLVATDYDEGGFTRLPGSMPSASADVAVFQVRMQRGALGRFGLPVEQDRAADWVDVDFLVGEDGTPQAVRLHQDSQSTAKQ